MKRHRWMVVLCSIVLGVRAVPGHKKKRNRVAIAYKLEGLNPVRGKVWVQCPRPGCLYGTDRADVLENHLRGHDEGQQKACSWECGFSHAARCLLLRHMQQCPQKPATVEQWRDNNRCTINGCLWTGAIDEYSVHLKEVHESPCPIDLSTFASDFISTSDSDNSPAVELGRHPVRGEVWVKCPSTNCGLKYDRSYEYRQHCKGHESGEQLTCEWGCGYHHAAKVLWLRHMAQCTRKPRSLLQCGKYSRCIEPGCSWSGSMADYNKHVALEHAGRVSPQIMSDDDEEAQQQPLPEVSTMGDFLNVMFELPDIS